MGDWVVVLEFKASRSQRPFEFHVVQGLVERLTEWHSAGLYSTDRYTVQLQLPALGADEALRMAAMYHEQAARPLDAPPAFIRAEVLTLEEFEAIWPGTTESTPENMAAGAPPPAVPAVISTEVYEATRALLNAARPTEAVEILVDFVLAVGGQISMGRPQPLPGALCLDISLSPGEQLHAVAERDRVAGAILERWLPPLIQDASRALRQIEGRGYR
jgi:hypothetical protein